MNLIDILISNDPEFGTSYMFTICLCEYDKLKNMVLYSGMSIKIYRGFSFDKESEYEDIIKQFNLK